MNKDKRIRYKHVHALRDLAWCRNFAGIKIKKGLLYRSGYLGKLTPKQAKDFVEEFNIGYIFDLRTNAEVEHAPDVQIEGIKYYHVPLIEHFENPVITKENRNQILLDISKNRGGAVKYFSTIYRQLVTDEYSLKQLIFILEFLLNKEDDKAVIFHCTQGKDRTGFLAAMILFLLGVDRYSIFVEYTRFNNAYRVRNFTISALAAIRFLSFKVSKDLYSIQMANKKLIQASFNEINKKYPNRYLFFKGALGFNDDKIQAFRTKYLVK